MAERPRILVLDLLESYARERDVDVGLVRRRDRREWVCMLRVDQDDDSAQGLGRTAREAITKALTQMGVEIPA
jgi:hypothetical protein